MSLKITSLNPFDKGFFGKTLRSYPNQLNVKNAKSAKLELDSFDDFNKHFQDKLYSHKHTQPIKDTFTSTPKEELSKSPILFPEIFF